MKLLGVTQLTNALRVRVVGGFGGVAGGRGGKNAVFVVGGVV